MTRVHIYAPSGYKIAFWKDCPDCGDRSLFLGTGWEWHGPHVTCMRCGRTFQDGEWTDLKFVPQSRRLSRAAALRMFLGAEKEKRYFKRLFKTIGMEAEGATLVRDEESE